MYDLYFFLYLIYSSCILGLCLSLFMLYNYCYVLKLKVLLRSNLGICFWLHISKMYVKVTYRAKFGVQIWLKNIWQWTFINNLTAHFASKNFPFCNYSEMYSMYHIVLQTINSLLMVSGHRKKFTHHKILIKNKVCKVFEHFWAGTIY